MIKPPRIFVYYLTIALIFGGLSYVIPEKGIQIGSFPYRIKWFPFTKLHFQSSLEEMDAELENKDSVTFISDSALLSIVDTISPRKDFIEIDTLQRLKRARSVHLSYSSNFQRLLYNFYREISSADSLGKVIRVLHMGDSQIEGDRITKYIRERFQEKFGGCGPGLIPVFDPHKQFPSVWITNKGKWAEHVVYKYPRLIKDNQYGLLGRVSLIDSVGVSAVKISKSILAEPKAGSYYKSRLFIENIVKPVVLDAYWEGNKISSDTLLKDENLTEINWTFKESPKYFSLYFESDESPIFLGMSLDSLAGIAVDNISMRGQSTPRLDKTNKELLKSMADYMNIGMVILQYGTNMVPTITDNYEFYSHTFYQQLSILKQTMPDVPVVVVGVGDVATVQEGKAKSYHHVAKIKEAQKNAALKAGFAFFDLFDAMGGEGAMIKWVNEDPRYALTDYTHFNKKGGKKVAEWIYNAIMSDYNNWNETIIFNNKSFE